MTQDRFVVYFYFLGSVLSFIEIKRSDLGDEKDPGKLYHWLRNEN